MYKLIAIIALSLTALSGCVVYKAWDACETMRQGEIRFEFPADEIRREIKVEHTYMALPPPPDCDRFYNNGHHREWADCMGVGYK